ncbi:hypothetical protein [Saccharopolyspora pogona]|uniref:hypothetical protein n=1 Tax=Saccharopolyspora pogona TaxID=333966 RepID=UPI001687A4A0|nr:hypothetical protein [Saccharopolyspora pogona]
MTIQPTTQPPLRVRDVRAAQNGFEAAALPPASATLGLRLIDANTEMGTIELAFTATEDFTNPAGN